MKKLLLLACLFCSQAFAQSAEELASQAKVVIELRLCPGGPQTFLIYVFNEEGNRVVLNDETLQDPFNKAFLVAVFANKSAKHQIFHLCGIES